MTDDTSDSAVRVEPVPGEPAATAAAGGDRLLLVADYHAGYEAGLRSGRGVDVPSRAPDRRERLLALLERTNPDRLVVLGDLMHSIGDPGSAERGELEVLFESFPSTLSVTVVKGNHDGEIETWLVDGSEHGDGPGEVTVVPGDGIAIDGLGVCHGHTWPAREVLESDVVCLGHEHPCVRLEDEVGGSRVERAWLRGRADPVAFRDHDRYGDGVVPLWLEDDARSQPRLVVLPAFNDLVGGTWVNLSDQSFLAPFLPGALADGEAYLLDGTRLGPYDAI
ncbi:metallophosphoesterase [Natronobacterium gregoryi]|uniref:Phosphoesterase n=2 Tax=Natronobacterium gregoryi TaxID=44930 RepID=L0AFD1_NATGS|nr:metallophosphoesterase [Natronobacterium gregoryi]AFZ71852.1 putative phosphoesterase, ICC [Natronobacterium gregoryi SP2]ELY73078.1 metallophosphoesterase [Natronobacterium gregoryi SP2]PLK19369.1 phosphoesterase [Natronobacterium gregoryi SP2]SFJ50294.1 putative phosphoesterase [Natronobacterium gregoryi]